MSNLPVIEVRNIGKTYEVFRAKEHYLALRDVLMSLARMPLRLFKGKNSSKTAPFKALDDVSFSVARGEIVGVIGANGAGKSTLLKILNRITDPSKGEVVVRGTVSALLEVGTGFHPELTGRENIYFSGAILGMRRKEIDAKFERIVEFAEVAEFLDMPVKRYSSGMQVRLAFSVAIHMEPDVLLIDEVLAVGDAAFQKKCLDKIHDAARKDNRAILFVSHNLDVVQAICDRCVYLEKGQVRMIAEPEQAIRAYLEHRNAGKGEASVAVAFDETKRYQITGVTVRDSEGVPTTELDASRPFSVEVEYDVRSGKDSFWVSLQCVGEMGNVVFTSFDTDRNPDLLAGRVLGRHRSTFSLSGGEMTALNVGRYALTVKIPNDPTIEVNIALNIVDPQKRLPHHPGSFLIGTPWKIESGL